MDPWDNLGSVCYERYSNYQFVYGSFELVSFFDSKKPLSRKGGHQKLGFSLLRPDVGLKVDPWDDLEALAMFTWGISAAHLFPSGLPPPWLTSLGNSRSLSRPRSSRRLRPLCLVRPPRPPSDWLPAPSWRRSSAEITVVDITRPGRQQPPGAQRHTWPPTTPQWGLKFTQNHPKESGM